MTSHEPEGVQHELQSLEEYKVIYDGDKVKAFSKWAREHADRLYPDVGRLTYVVPPLFVHKHSMRYDPKAGADVLQETQKSSPKGEKAHCHVTLSISLLSQMLDKPLFVVSGLEYDNMLKWVRTHPDLAPHLPDAVEKRGDIDLMAVHPDVGLVFIQVKAVGDNPESRTDTEIQKKIVLGGKQLCKDQNIFRWVLHDWPEATGCRITRVVALPNLSRDELKAFWPPADFDPESEDGQCMNGVVFLHKDDLPSEQPHIPDADIDVTSLFTWWTNNVATGDGRLKEEFMKDIVSRYVGLLSAVEVYTGNNLRKEVRSHSDAVDVCGMMFRRILLNEQQLRILTTPCQRRYLSGPPGSGKTVLLVLRARQHVRQGGRVVVVNMYRGAAGRAIGHFIKDAVGRFRIPHASDGKKSKSKSKAKKKKTGEEQGGGGSGNTSPRDTSPRDTVVDHSHLVHIVDVDIGPASFKSDVFRQNIRQQLEQDANPLTQAATGTVSNNPLAVADTGTVNSTGVSVHKGGVKPEDIMFIVDEIYVKDYWEGVLNVLGADYKQSHVWCAGLYSRNPPGFEQEDLSLVLRCSPAVQKVLYAVDWDADRRKCYQLETDPSGIYTPGLTPISVRHSQHPQVTLTECEECAREVALLLKRGFNFDALAEPHPGLVTCSDVVILANIPRALYEPDEKGFLDTTLQDFKNYMEYLQSCRLVSELGKQDIPVNVVTKLPCHSLYNTEAQHHVHVTWAYTYQGLENKVVVYLPGDTPWKKDTLPSEIPAPGLSSLPRNVPKVWKPVKLNDVVILEDTQGCEVPESPVGQDESSAKTLHSEGNWKSCPSSDSADGKNFLLCSAASRAKAAAAVSETAASNIATVASKSALSDSRQQKDTGERLISQTAAPRCLGGKTGIVRHCSFSVASKHEAATESAVSTDLLAHSESRSRADSGGQVRGSKRPEESMDLTLYFWRQADIDRYSNWDKANLFVAGSRCLSQLIMLIP